MGISRRGVVARVPLAVAALAPVRPSAGSAPPDAIAVHRATRNTWLGALGEALPDLAEPPPRVKAYDGRERLALPEPNSEGRPFVDALGASDENGRQEAAASRMLTLAEVARELRLANGVTGTRAHRDGVLHLRAAPSAGALYSNEVYLLCAAVDGLAPGAYYYDVIDDALVALRSDDPSQTLLRAVECPKAASASAWIVLTNVFRRYRFRYSNRGYRYALIDSGHIGENIALAARAAELPFQRVDRFADDRIGELLGVDGVDEATCALYALAPRSGSIPAAATVTLRPRGESRAPDALARYHGATKLVAAASEEADPGRAVRPRTDSPVALAGTGDLRSVDAAIRERRSTRRFQEQPLSAEALAYLARAAGAPLVHAPALSLHAIVHRAEGVAPGHYRYDPATHRLERQRTADLRGSLRRICLGQRKAGDAAVAFIPVADLRAVVAAEGERGYRHLLLDAGALGQRLYIAAEAAGLTARNLAAFIDDGLNDLLGVDGREHAAVHLTVAGHGD